ncbi:hypothetical protein PAESOLCIP111_03680 [Paenibacillus solanacearum]|uniref:Uncharacterized protein n=1 Tax=Paenibacillus solanacearum TaxID=2048548 RepID=A0A916NXY0_9BACL|nr:hypothetical protein [Paenibacillus solanacearum]CAG7635585.1 hypothetical protein PAESOLCIP111_03680 [Paenibacillus solanacearum]
MTNKANSRPPIQELDVLKIIDELGLDPDRLFDYFTAIEIEELEIFI